MSYKSKYVFCCLSAKYKSKLGFSGGTVVKKKKKKNLPDNAGDTRDMGLIPGSGQSPGVGNGNLLQYSRLENSMDRGAWQATVHGSQRVRHD